MMSYEYVRGQWNRIYSKACQPPEQKQDHRCDNGDPVIGSEMFRNSAKSFDSPQSGGVVKSDKTV